MGDDYGRRLEAAATFAEYLAVVRERHPEAAAQDLVEVQVARFGELPAFLGPQAAGGCCGE